MSIDCFRGGWFARITALITLFFFTFVFYANPAAAAVANELKKEQERENALDAALMDSPEAVFSYRLSQFREKLIYELPQLMAKRDAEQNWFQRALAQVMGDMPITESELSELTELQKESESVFDEVIENLEADIKVYEDKKLEPAIKTLIQSRHQEALAHVQSHQAQLKSQWQQLLKADSRRSQQQAFDALQKNLKQEQFESTHTPLNPAQMPWSMPAKETREPIMTSGDLLTYLDVNPWAHYPQVAQAGDPDPELMAELFRNAQNADLQEGLKETLEVQITPEIKALADSLNNNSIQIYTWVHNNIKFIPSYGSIQGAQHTLETKQGNAMDTASLLIALLRSAKIPARYAYGTVEVPVAQVMNWVGDAKTPEAAQQLLNIGGVPTSLIKRNGVLTHLRMEHVWVEAYVDFQPSRGQVEKTGDTWIPMDASFKQYEFTQGMNLKDQVAFDAQPLADAIQSKATINETEGWVQNVPQADIEAQLTQFQNQLKTYIEQQNPDATVGDVLGLQDIKVLPARPLAAGLPYSRLVTSQTFYDVPDRLRHKFQYTLSGLYYGQASGEYIRIEEPTAKLAGKTLSLSFKPSTPADEAIITSRLPAPEANGSIDPAKLPQSLPGYLINMNAEFTINGETIKSVLVGKMGSELHEEMGIYTPNKGWETSVNYPIAGSYRAIALDLQGANPEQAARLKQQLDATKAKLESEDDLQLATLTKHELVGSLLFGTVFNYFALNDLQDQIAAQSSGIITYRLPSYGTFSTNLKPDYFFGLPRNVKFAGLSMDIDRIKMHHVAQNNSTEEQTLFSQNIGSRQSAMEHLVPEQMFSTEDNKAQGISAVKALAIASAEGQKIFTITPNNLELALSNITLSAESENDIRNAVNAGKVVTAHEHRINFNGWIGEGYTVIDPETGAGGYIIAGGGNGAILMILGLVMLASLFFLVMPLLSLVAGSGGLLAIPALLAFASYFLVGMGLFLKGLSMILRSFQQNSAADAVCKFSGYSFNAAIGAIFGYLANTFIGKFLVKFLDLKNDKIMQVLSIFVVLPTVGNVGSDAITDNCQ